MYPLLVQIATPAAQIILTPQKIIGTNARSTQEYSNAPPPQQDSVCKLNDWLIN